MTQIIKLNQDNNSENFINKLKSDNVESLAKSLWFELQRQKKLSNLDQLIAEVRRRKAREENRIIVEIFSSVELEEVEKNDINEKLEKKLDSKIMPRYKIDSSLLGGLKIKINDDVLDLSWRGKLEKIKDKTGR